MSRVVGVLVVLVSVVSAVAAEADDAMPRHREGPALVDLGDGVEIELPAGMLLFERTEARALLEAGGDSPEGVIGVVMPAGESEWTVTIELQAVGHVSDADAGQLDAGEMLGQIGRGTVAQNAVRRTKGVPELFLDGWSAPPSYVRERRALTWGLRLHSEDGPLLNEITNVLGRSGYAGLDLIASPDTIVAARAEAAGAMTGVRYQPGHRYQDFDPRTDHDSGMNLRNLVVGAGVVAAGSKLGLFAAIAVFLKKIAVGIAAACAGVWKWITGRRKKAAEAPLSES